MKEYVHKLDRKLSVLKKQLGIFHTGDTFIDLPFIARRNSIQMYVDGLGHQSESLPGDTLSEALVDQAQLSNTDGILGGIFAHLPDYPAEGTTWTMKTDTVTVVYTFTATPVGDYDMLTGSGDIMADWVTKINANHVAHGDPFTAVLVNPVTALGGDYAPFIMSADPTARCFGDAWRIKSFVGIAYSITTWSTSVAPTADPVTSNFGFSKAHGILAHQEAHSLLVQGTKKKWDASTDTWITALDDASLDFTVDYTGGYDGKTRINYTSRLTGKFTDNDKIIISYAK
jgi:hypothetical protein